MTDKKWKFWVFVVTGIVIITLVSFLHINEQLFRTFLEVFLLLIMIPALVSLAYSKKESQITIKNIFVLWLAAAGLTGLLIYSLINSRLLKSEATTIEKVYQICWPLWSLAVALIITIKFVRNKKPRPD
jgi:hypothetical protein